MSHSRCKYNLKIGDLVRFTKNNITTLTVVSSVSHACVRVRGGTIAFCRATLRPRQKNMKGIYLEIYVEPKLPSPAPETVVNKPRCMESEIDADLIAFFNTKL